MFLLQESPRLSFYSHVFVPRLQPNFSGQPLKSVQFDPQVLLLTQTPLEHVPLKQSVEFRQKDPGAI